MSTVPYTEQVDGQEVYLTTQKNPVAIGHVNGVEWSLAAYDTRPYAGDAFPRFLGGACGDLMVGDQGEYGGIGFCLHTGETVADAAFAMAGFGNNLDRQADPIIGYAGLVDSQVATVELRLAVATSPRCRCTTPPPVSARGTSRSSSTPGTAGASSPSRRMDRRWARAGSASTRRTGRPTPGAVMGSRG